MKMKPLLEENIANLKNDHGFIIKEYYLHSEEAFSKAQSGQYHIVMESRIHLITTTTGT